MTLLTEEEEKEIAEQVAADSTPDDSLSELVSQCVDESGGQMNPATARRLLLTMLPRYE